MLFKHKYYLIFNQRRQLKKLTDYSMKSVIPILRHKEEALKLLSQLYETLFITSTKLHKGWGWICFRIGNVSSDTNEK